MTQLVKIKTINNLDTDIQVGPGTIQEVRIIRNFALDATRFLVQITLISGRSYYLATEDDKMYFENRADAEALRDTFIATIPSTGGGGAVESVNGRQGVVTGLVDEADIVDNLTTNDATKPLSAKQGKVLQDSKVNKTLTIIGLDLQDNILIGEFRTALGNATQSVAGLLSAADKTHLDNLVALLETSDGNNVVDTIGEILAIFNNYPEGADLVTALAGKVDKVEGKGLSTEDYTTTEKTKLSGIEAGAQVNTVTTVAGRTGAVVLAKADVGLGNVQNYTVASKAQAEAGTSNDLYMTPLRTKELITAVMGDIESALDAILGV